MVEYQCEKCSQYFNRKFLYDQHCKRKTSCVYKGSKGSKSQKVDINKCKKCNKTFSRKDSLNRHMPICKVKVDKIVNKKATISDGKKNTIINGKDIISIPGNNNVAFNKNNININLVVFAKDGIENISLKDLKKMLKSDTGLVEGIISNVNLNPNKPQHHNIYYGDIKSTYGEVYENKKWVRKKINEILNTLVKAKIEDLNEILNDMNDFLNEKTRNKIKNAIENYDSKETHDTDKKLYERKKLLSYLKPLIYNHKDMIIKTRKLSKKQEEEIFKKELEEIEANY